MEDALCSEYMAPLHQVPQCVLALESWSMLTYFGLFASLDASQGRPLPEPEAKFSFGFDKAGTTQTELRDMIWQEMSNFHPEVGSRKN